jgi:hypothetical protein
VVVIGCQIWAVSRMGKNSPSHFCDCLTCAQVGVRPGIVMCLEVEAGNFTSLVYSVLHNVGKSMLNMMEILWKNSLIIAKDIWIIHIHFIVIAFIFSERKNWRHYLCITNHILILHCNDPQLLCIVCVWEHFGLTKFELYKFKVSVLSIPYS